jgi:3-oxoacyl-[acyl-carrier protein] reductase
MSGSVVVTGAARGIGAAIATRFAQAGWHPLVIDFDPSVRALAAKLGATAVVADVTDAAGRAAITEQMGALPEPARVLVNNAGITRDALIKRMEEDQFLAVIRVNLGAAYELSTVLAPLLSDGGSIVNVSSKSASGNVGQYNYAVSKAGLLGLTRSMALELAPRVRVNAIAPAFVATEMTAAIPNELRERFIARIPFGRAGEPEEIASVVEWLASDGASYVTGQVLPVCGGRSFGSS